MAGKLPAGRFAVRCATDEAPSPPSGRVMLAGSRARILEVLGEDDLVLDVGGGANPFERADWVIDLLAYEERGHYGAAPARPTERFSSESWIQRDICDRSPWPFADRQFEFSVCSHTLEDVRDPLFVCSELIRVSHAGYIEVPSRLEEQSYGFQGPWAGWSHHRWLVDLADGGGLTFVSKPHVLHGSAGDHFPSGFRDGLTAERSACCRFVVAGLVLLSRADLPRRTVARRLSGRVRGRATDRRRAAGCAPIGAGVEFSRRSRRRRSDGLDPRPRQRARPRPRSRPAAGRPRSRRRRTAAAPSPDRRSCPRRAR